MDINPLLLPYVPLVDYIGRVFGEDCEVILHDLSDIEHSIVAMANGHLTNRQVGGHITDFGLKVVYDPRYQDKAYAVNYLGTTPDGSRRMKSSTFFIRDEKNTVVGLLCINIDITDLTKAKNILEKLVYISEPEHSKQKKSTENDPPVLEIFSSSVEDTIRLAISRVLQEMDVPPKRMTLEEKIQVVRELHNHGLFALKGAVCMVAKGLDVSEQTVYRYLREVSTPLK